MALDVPTLVVDASVAVKWYLSDEDYADQAGAHYSANSAKAISSW